MPCMLSRCCLALQVWSRTVGPSSAWIVDYAITSLAFGICIVYACFVGDTFSSLFKGLGLPAFISSREASIVAVTATTLFPLTLLRVRPYITSTRTVLHDVPWSYHTSMPPPSRQIWQIHTL